MKQLMKVIAVLAVMWGNQYSNHADGVGEAQYDFSTPEGTFRSIGRAIAKDDALAVFSHLVNEGGRFTFEQFVEGVWKPNLTEGTRGVLSGSETVVRNGKVIDYFEQAEFFLLVKERRKGDNILRQYLVRWKQGGLMRQEDFLHKNGEAFWRWQGMNANNQDGVWPGYASPKNAYATVERVKYIEQTELIVEALALRVRGEKTCDKLVTELGNQLKQRSGTGANPMDRLHSGPVLTDSELEEERVPSADNGQFCRVWHVDANTHKKGHPEVFVKEADEWKWIPDEKSFWHPKNWQRADKPLTGTPTGKAPSSSP